MTAARLKRLQRLESRRPKMFVPFDEAGAVALLKWFLDCHTAVEAGKASRLPVYGPPTTPSLAFELRMRELDAIAARLAAPVA